LIHFYKRQIKLWQSTSSQCFAMRGLNVEVARSAGMGSPDTGQVLATPTMACNR